MRSGAASAEYAAPNIERNQEKNRAIDYLIFLIALTIAPKSGQSPESSLECRALPLARISKPPPLEGISVGDLMSSPSSKIWVAKLTAFGVKFQTPQPSHHPSFFTSFSP